MSPVRNIISLFSTSILNTAADQNPYTHNTYSHGDPHRFFCNSMGLDSSSYSPSSSNDFAIDSDYEDEDEDEHHAPLERVSARSNATYPSPNLHRQSSTSSSNSSSSSVLSRWFSGESAKSSRSDNNNNKNSKRKHRTLKQIVTRSSTRSVGEKGLDTIEEERGSFRNATAMGSWGAYGTTG